MQELWDNEISKKVLEAMECIAGPERVMSEIKDKVEN